jgi:plastocyanin
MSAQRIAGTVAVISAAGLLVLGLVSSVVGAWSGPGWTIGTGTPGAVAGPGMMGGGFGPSMMGGGVMGPAMMGGGMGPGMMMGSGHMGFGYGAGSQGASAPIAGAPTVTVTATDLKLAPTEITLASREVNVTLVNNGAVLHDLTIPALGVRVVAAAGQTTTVGLRDLPPGRYVGYCSVPGHADAGMRIAVTVP